MFYFKVTMRSGKNHIVEVKDSGEMTREEIIQKLEEEVSWDSIVLRHGHIMFFIKEIESINVITDEEMKQHFPPNPNKKTIDKSSKK